MSEIALVEATFADVDEAERIGITVIAERLAACINITPCASIYRWNGKVEHGAEAIGRFKTTGLRARRLKERIGELHSYQLPAIVTTIATVEPAVADWVAEAVDQG